MKRLRAVPALLLAGLCCLLAAFLLPGSADADTNHDVEVSVAGGAFTSFSSRPLLDVSALAPGDSTAAVMGVRNNLRSAGVLYLRMRDVRDDDNGCVRPERAVDTTCGRGDGDLGRALRFTVATAADEHGPYTARWTGPADGLTGTLDTHLRIASSGTRWIRMSATLPAGAGRRVETDTFGFGLGVIVRGRAGSGGAGVGGKHAHRPGSPGGGGLAATGVAMTALIGVGALLVILGLLALASAWRRKRVRATASDEGKHRSQ